MGFYSRSLMDFDSELTTIRVSVPDLNAGNIAAELTKQATFGTTLNGITTGSLQRIAYGNEVSSLSPAPLDQWSQREIKWLVTYADAVTGKKYRIEVGTADLDKLDPLNRDSADFDDADVSAFITAFEDYVVAPLTGNATQILSIVPVGRNT